MATLQQNEGKVVSLINMKGGVGKTTLAVGLAWELAKNYEVLLVDVDPQFNATQWLIDDSEYIEWLKNKRTVFDVYVTEGSLSGIGGFSRSRRKRSDTTLKNTVMQVKRLGTTLDVIPSNLELIMLDAAPRGTENRLKMFLEAARKKYDYVIIDCPPTASLFSYSAHIASDAYLVPIKPDPLSILGLPLLERTMESYEERSGHSAVRLGLVLSLVRGTAAMKTATAKLRAQYPDDVYTAVIKQTTGVAEAVEKGLPLQVYAKTKNNPNIPLTKIAAEFVRRIEA